MTPGRTYATPHGAAGGDAYGRPGAWQGRAEDPASLSLRANYRWRVKVLRLLVGAAALPCAATFVLVVGAPHLWSQLGEPIRLTPTGGLLLWAGVVGVSVLVLVVVALTARCPRCKQPTPLLLGSYAACPHCRFVFREDRVRVGGRGPDPAPVFREALIASCRRVVVPEMIGVVIAAGGVLALVACYLDIGGAASHYFEVRWAAGLAFTALTPFTGVRVPCPACAGSVLTVTARACPHCTVDLASGSVVPWSMRVVSGTRPVVGGLAVAIVAVLSWGPTQPTVMYRMLAHGVGIGGSGLAFAILVGDEPSARYLLARGADPDERGVGDEPVLMNAVRCNDLEGRKGEGVLFVRMLLEAGADPADRDGRSPLGLAALNGDAIVVGLLLSAGAATEGSAALDEPLYFAATEGHPEIVEMLVRRGARPDGSGRGCGPLAAAAGEGHASVVRILLRHGADVDGSLRCERRPLVRAEDAGRAEVSRLLRAAGARS